jgi:sortase A
MIRLGRITNGAVVSQAPLTMRARVLLTLSNTLMLAGLILLLYVGGLYANAEYNRYAARGDTDEPAPQPVVPSVEESVRLAVAPGLEREPAPFVPTAPQSEPAPAEEGRVAGIIPQIAGAVKLSQITRVMIPSIDVDSKVVNVGWDVQVVKGERVAVWQVAEYAIGHHIGSANPGEGNNIVLAGHVGGYGKVFKDLIKLVPGERITLYTGDTQHQYVVSETLLVTEEGVSAEQQAANARYIAPTDREMITLVTCWPDTGKGRFSQRVIVRALPVRTDDSRRTETN